MSDVDSGSGTVTGTLSVDVGILTVVVGSTGAVISSGDGTGSVVVTGTVVEVNDLLTAAGGSSITYVNNSDTPSASATISVTVNDGGNTGTGANGEDSASQTITITAINDNPTNAGSLPSDITVTEDVSSDVDLSAVDFSDVDAGSSSLTVTLTTSTGGNLTAAAGTGITLGGTSTAVTLTGSLTNLNNYFNTASNITYLHGTADTNGDNADTIAVVINDGGNTGSGGGTNQALGTVNVDITAINDAPVVLGPITAFTVNEQTNLAITDFSVSDVDSGSGTVTGTLSVDEGILTVVVGSTGAVISSGDGTDSVVVTGTVAQVNNLLTGVGSSTITYVDNSNTPSATATISVTVNDGGNTGSGVDEEHSASQTINVKAVNDAPVVVGPGSAYAVNEQTDLAIHNTGFSVTDVDSDTGTVTATLAVDEGILTVTVGSSGAAIASGDATGSVVVTGTVAQVNNLLTGVGSSTITYVNNSNTPSATATISVTVNDGGNTGAGANGEDSASQTINVTAINDAPTFGATLDGTPTYVEGQTAVVFDNAIDITDADLDALNSGNGDYAGSTLTLVRNGGANTDDVLSMSEVGGFTLAGGDLLKGGVVIGTFDTTTTAGQLVITFSDANQIPTSADVDAIMQQLTYSNPNDTPPGSVIINWTFSDGNSADAQGTGPAKIAKGSTTVTITATNDAPVVSAPSGALAATEQTNLAIHGAGFTVADTDSAAGTVTATLAVDEGVLSVVVGDSGVTLGAGNGTGSVALTGTVVQVNKLLTASGGSTGTITYNNGSNTPSASTTLTVTVNDGGNTGTDPGLTSDGTSAEDSASQTINITAVNDTPDVVAPLAAYTVNEQTDLVIHGTGFSVTDTDSAAGTVMATLAVGEGSLSVVVGDSGVTLGAGDGTDSVVVTGTVVEVNKLLTASGGSTGTITYNNGSNTPSASTTLTVTVNDGGNTGTDPGLTGDGTSEEDSASQTINVTAVNDTPDVVAPLAAYTVNEQTDLVIHGTGFSVTDTDSAAGSVTATLMVGEGVISVVAGDSGVTVDSGNGTDSVVVTGTVVEVNKLLTASGGSTGTITYNNGSNTPSASTTLTVTVNDGGNTGTDPGLTGDGTSEEDSASQTINVTAVNDTPDVVAPLAAYTVNEQTDLVIHGTGFSVTDTDSASGIVTATLAVGEGSLSVVVGDSGATLGAGNGTDSVVVTGTVAEVNKLLTASGGSTGTITYNNGSNTPSASTTLTVTVNDGGNTGTDPGLTSDGTSEEDSASQTINITAVNDTPDVVAPLAAYTVNEQTDLAIHGTGFSVTDSDSAAGTVTATLAVGEGSLSVVTGDSGVMLGAGDGTESVVVTGTVAEVNKLLTASSGSTGTITYNNGSNTPSASTTLTVTVNDSGNTGTDPGLTGDGSSEEDSATQTINITAVNDTPDVIAPLAAYTVNEQTDLAIHGTGFSVTDTDSASGIVTATLAVGEGSLSVVAGDSDVMVVSGDGTGSVVLTGTVAQVNKLLTASGGSTGTITYNNGSNTPSASTTLIVTVNDSGNTGTDPGLTGDGSSEEGSASQTINITAVNDTPDVIAPLAAYSVNEQTDLAIHGTGFSVTDSDSAAGIVTATLAVGEGSLSVVAGDSDVTVVSGDGTDSVVLTGTVAQVNDLLSDGGTGTITYNNGSDTPSASTTLTVTVNDGGNTGIDSGLTGDGISEEGSASQTINITAVNDTPTVSGPGSAYTVNEQTDLVIHGTGFSVTDTDSATGIVTATLAVGEGSLSVVTGDSDVTVISGDGTDSVVLTGTVAQLNDLLSDGGTGTITYNNGSNTPSTSTTLTVTINDGGNTGIDSGLTGDGTSEEGSASQTINITAVNDTPEVIAPLAAYSVNEQADLAIHGTGFSVTDTDSDTGVVTATLAVGEGSIIVVAGDSDVTVGSGNGTGSVVFTGTVAQVNSLLSDGSTGTITYNNGSNTPSASTTLTVIVNDAGNTGTDPGLSGDGSSEEASASQTINIAAINDTPDVVAPLTAYTVNEQTGLAIHGTGFSVTDTDAASGTVTATLAVLEGAITVVEGDSGVTITSGDGTGTVVLNGTVAQVNNLLTDGGTGTITYYNDSDTPSASTTFTVTVNDEGNSGNDSGLTGNASSEEGSATQTINITAINDTPIVSSPDLAYTVNEQTDFSIHGTGFSVTDTDSAADSVTANLVVGEGIISVVTGDSGVTIVSGDGTDEVVLIGTVAQLNNLLIDGGTGTITYNNDSDTPSASTTLSITVNDNGNTGSGGAQEHSASQTITLTAINDAPVVSAPVLALSATEQTNLAIHGAGFGVVDADAGSGTVTALLTVDEGSLTIEVGDSGVTLGAGDGTESVVVTGTVAAVNKLLVASEGSTGTITYVNSSDTPSPSATISVTVNDNGNTGVGGAADSTALQTINITAVNDAPTLDLDLDNSAATNNDFMAVWTEGSGAIAVTDNDASLQDIDSGNLTSLLVVLENPLDSSDEILMANTTGTSIGSSYNSATGVLSLTGDQSVADYEQVLKTIRYDNASENPNVTDRTITFVASDGALQSALATTTISINAVNNAPVFLTEDLVIAQENQTAVVTLTSSDPDGGLPSYSIVGGDDFSLFSIDESSGILTFSTAPNFEIPADVDGDNVYKILVQVADGNDGRDQQEVSVRVTNTNEAPEISSANNVDSVENQTTVFKVEGTDVDGEVPRYLISGGVDANLFAIDELSGELTFKVAPDFEAPGDTGIDNTYEVVVVAIDSAGVTTDQLVTITVTDSNEEPQAVTDRLIAREDTLLIIDPTTELLVNDTDPEAGNLELVAFTQPEHGSLISMPDGQLQYQPDADFNGLDQFDYTIRDDGGNTSSGTVELDVEPVNDAPEITPETEPGNKPDNPAPVITGGVIEVAENTDLIGVAAANDVDGDAISFVVTGVDADLFEIDSVTGALRPLAPLDFEQPRDSDLDNNYEVEIVASDVFGEQVRVSLTISAVNVNEPPALIEEVFTLEAGFTGTLGTLTATDPDTDELFEFELVTVNGVEETSSKVVLSTSGEIRASGLAPGTYELAVAVTDIDGLVSMGTVVVFVNPLADALPSLGAALPTESEVELDIAVQEVPSVQAVVSFVPAIAESTQSRVSALTVEMGFANVDAVQLDPFVAEDSIGFQLAEQGGGIVQLYGVMSDAASQTIVPLLSIVSDTTTPSALQLHDLIDRVRSTFDSVDEQEQTTERQTAVVVAVGGVALSIGMAGWLLGSRVLLAVALTTVPLWRGIDPIPVLLAGGRDDDETADDEKKPEDKPEDEKNSRKRASGE
ncbi:MAG: Ig-like domain-containing protein [Granulosicoccus sp.]